MTENKTIDTRGMAYPRTIIKTKKTIDDLEEGDILLVMADDPGVKEDFPVWCEQTGNKLLKIEVKYDDFYIYIRKGGILMHGDRFFQRLITEAYDIWSKNNDWSYEEFVDALDEKHKAAVLVAAFDSHVDEDGFVQWEMNEYSGKVDDLLEVLIRFVEDTDSEAGKKVIKVIKTYKEKYFKIDDRFMEEFSNWLVEKYGKTEKESDHK